MTESLSIVDIGLRIGAAVVAGAIVGWERESHGRAAGLRTTILACVAAAVSMILSEMLFVKSVNSETGGNWRPDPARLGAGILTGIGFLGAGTILRHMNVIRGVTTAATLWFVTVLGLALGAGQFFLGTVGIAVAVVTLLVLPNLERFIPGDWYVNLTVTAGLDADEDVMRQRLKALGLQLKRVQLDYDFPAARKTLVFELKLERQKALTLPQRTVAELRQCPGVLRVKWE
jgi:putative Mg2+ transporter-C (MgtC) family protein